MDTRRKWLMDQRDVILAIPGITVALGVLFDASLGTDNRTKLPGLSNAATNFFLFLRTRRKTSVSDSLCTGHDRLIGHQTT